MNQNNDLNQTEQWYRGVLYGALIWGVTVSLIFSGWVIAPNEIASFAHTNNSTACFDSKLVSNACFLAIFTPLVIIAWISIIEKIHKHCPNHSTIISKLTLRIAYGLI